MSNEVNEPEVIPCTVCGRDARVWLSGVPYCLSCYNCLMDNRAGIVPPANDDYRILALDAEGRAVEFGVERFSTGVRSIWTAVEDVSDDDPRKSQGYEGRSMSIGANHHEVDDSEALDKLMRKTQLLTAHASIDTSDYPSYANETGVARIASDTDGRHYLVVDGQQMTGDEFLEALMSHEGFDLYWSIRDMTDEVPDWL